MTRRAFIPAIVVAVGFLAFRQYEQSQLWNAAYSHFARRFVENDTSFNALARGCEASAIRQDFRVEGEWVRDTVRLQQGMPALDPFLKDYEFLVAVSKLSPLEIGREPSFLELTCLYLSASRVFLITRPD